jgi:PLD-like domain
VSEVLRTANEGLNVAAYRGDGATLLAFDVPEHMAPDLAGFAVEYTTPKGDTHPILNRLSFARPITAETMPYERRWTPSDRAPLQKFHWVHFPPDVVPGHFTYHVTAMLFRGDAGSTIALDRGPSASVSLELFDEGYPKFEIGFTRGYLSSQAYASRFHNAPVVPSQRSIDFDSSPYRNRWRWLGFHARRLVFDFLKEAVADDGLRLDVFAYDLNEPDILRLFKRLGRRLRLYLDDSSEHVKRTSAEVAARRMLERSAGRENVKTGHFSRFAHDKVLIQRRGETPVKVLSGSANFSTRGLYVQSNNIFVFDDGELAKLYGQAFDQSWKDPSGFDDSEIAAQWFERRGRGLPRVAVSFSPHRDPEVSLKRVADAIADAKSSVLFSVMELGGGGPVMEQIQDLPGRRLYAFGTTQRASGGLVVTSPGHPAVAVPFSYLKKQVHGPFQSEISGGSGQVIHNKFVVVDFNDREPLVFTGSSNLAAGGERENGDNLVCFADRRVATTYAVEAIRLIDHYRFRAVQKHATEIAPLVLKPRSAQWARDYYDPKNAKFRERVLFVS